MHDDDLLDALGAALAEDVGPVDESRVADIRAAALLHQSAAAKPADHAPTDTDTLTETQMSSLADHRAKRRSRLALVAAAAVVVIAGAVALLTTGSDDSPGGVVEYAGPITGIAGEGELNVVMTGIGRVIDLDTTALEILPTGEYYEIWFVGPGDSSDSPNRISAGTFHPDLEGRSQVTFAAAVDPAKYPIVEITAEPGDGDPAPTDAVVLRADLAG